MSQRNKASELLTAYGNHISIADLSLPETDSCQFRYEEGITINVDYLADSERLMLTAPILELPDGNRADAYTDLMELNLFWEELAGARFALLKEAGLVVLTHQLDIAPLSEKRFTIAMNSLAEAAQVWRDNLTGRFADEDAYTEAAAPDFMRV